MDILQAEGATGFGLAGALGGAAIGGISIAFKNSKTFTINGDQQRWKAFKQMINKWNKKPIIFDRLFKFTQKELIFLFFSRFFLL